jgi:energy-coupling factor transport system permease protein
MIDRFERFHPFVTFAYYTGTLSLFIIMLHPLFLMIGLLIILAVNYVKDRLRGVARWLLFMITTGLFIMIMNPLFNQRGLHVLFRVSHHRITLEAVVYGATNALLVITVMALFVSYNEVMTPNKLLYLFSKFLPQFAVLLMLTLRFIPLMRRRLAEISAIQMSKGLSIAHGPWKEKIQTSMLYVQVLLVHSLEEALQTADSMNARGYGQGGRTTYEYFHFEKRDLFALLYLVIFFFAVMYGRINGYGYLTIYPVMESLKLSTIDTILLVFYCFFISFPLLVETGGYLKWRLSN